MGCRKRTSVKKTQLVAAVLISISSIPLTTGGMIIIMLVLITMATDPWSRGLINGLPELLFIGAVALIPGMTGIISVFLIRNNSKRAAKILFVLGGSLAILLILASIPSILSTSNISIQGLLIFLWPFWYTVMGLLILTPPAEEE